MTDKIILEARGLSKSFKQGTNKIVILDQVDFKIKANEVVSLIGPSGCGKTTFLQILGLLDKPDSGQVIFGGVNYTVADDYAKTLYRRFNIGFIYQAYNLLNDFSALENAMLPLRVQGVPLNEAKSRALDILEILGLGERFYHLPGQLSGGEQQRVAIARSMIHEPTVILADEPTGNLDHDNAEKIIDILINLVKKLKKSLVIVTHNSEIAEKADRIVSIQNGKVKEQK